MAEKLVHIKNVVGSGDNGKVLLSDLDLSQQDLAKFTTLLSNYIKSGAFAADLSSPDTFTYGPRNYNMIPYFDSFELYLDKDIPGKLVSGDLSIKGVNTRKYNGGVSVLVDNSNSLVPSIKYLHPDSDFSEAAWMTTSESSVPGDSFYCFSGYFYFNEKLTSNLTFEVINKTNQTSGHSVVLTITPEDSLKALKQFYRFWTFGDENNKFQLTESDLLTMKLTIPANTVFYMDAFQLEKITNEYWTSYGQPRDFIQSGAVITDGMNIKLGSITASAISSNTISVDKLTPDIGSQIDISSNTVITAERAIKNLIDLRQQNFEIGSISTSDGSNITGNNFDTLRSKFPGFLINSINNVPLDLVFTVSKNIATDIINNIVPYSTIFWYGAEPNYQYLGYETITNASKSQYVTSPNGAKYFRVKVIKSTGTEFPLEDLFKTGTFVTVETMQQYISGAKYRFDGTAATFTNGGLIINNAFNNAAFTADTYGISLYNTSGNKTLWADSNGNLTLTGTLQGVDGTFSGTLQGADIQGGTIKIGTLSPVDHNSVFKANNTEGIWAGNTLSSDAPFKVSLSGALTATDATISGSINATSGFIGEWKIQDGKLTSNSGSGKVILDGPNNRLYLNTTAYLEPYSDSSIIKVSGGILTSGSVSSSYIEATAVIDGQTNSTLIFPTGITHSVYGTPARLSLNLSPIVTEANKASKDDYGVAKIWLEGTTLKIET